MDRRSFLGFAGGAVAGVAFDACGAGHSGQPPPKTQKTSSSSSTTTSRPTVGPPDASDWDTLSRSLSGSLVRPSDPGYPTALQLFDPTYDTISPQAIAYCESASDVVSCLAFVQDHAVAFSTRSGGHSYAGYSTSTGLVIDVTRQNSVELDSSAQTASIGAGSRLVDIYGTLGASGLALPGGSCPTVGIAGLVMGGGLGVIDRRYGLCCDNLLGATVVLASGKVVECSNEDDPDLYWAIRGGGGGNFGVATDFTFAVHPANDLGLFTLVWEWGHAADVVEAWQSWAPHAPGDVWSNCQLLNSQGTPSGTAPAARVTGVSVGSVSSLEEQVASFVSSVGSSPFDEFVGGDTYSRTMLIEAGCENDTVAECHLPSQSRGGILTRSPFAAKSDFLGELLPSTGISMLIGAVENRESSPVLAGGGIVLDASGGAINDVATDATAFVHRDALASIQYSASWGTGASASVVEANEQWLQDTWQGMRPYVNGEAYQNYIDRNLPDWQQAYYGSNLPRLRDVKRSYDPDDVFRFAQSIPL